VTLRRDPDDELDHDNDNERGVKDTVRVNPNEIVEIAVRFITYAGRYMYHCHNFEHEDRDRMRPFVTMPADAMPFIAGARATPLAGASHSPSSWLGGRLATLGSRLRLSAVAAARRLYVREWIGVDSMESLAVIPPHDDGSQREPEDQIRGG
jgi:hypothetical protein